MRILLVRGVCRLATPLVRSFVKLYCWGRALSWDEVTHSAALGGETAGDEHGFYNNAPPCTICSWRPFLDWGDVLDSTDTKLS